MSDDKATLPKGHFATIELRNQDDRIISETAVHPEAAKDEASRHRIAHALASLAGELSPTFQEEMDMTTQMADAHLDLLEGKTTEGNDRIITGRSMTSDGILSGIVITVTGFVAAVLLIWYAFVLGQPTLGWFSIIALVWTVWGLLRAGMALPFIASWHLMKRKRDDG